MINKFIIINKNWLKLTKSEINSQNLNYGEIILLGVIKNLSDDDQCCTASNAYFTDTLCTTERNIQKYLKKLKDFGIIKTCIQKQWIIPAYRIIYIQYDRIKELIKNNEQENEYENNIKSENNYC